MSPLLAYFSMPGLPELLIFGLIILLLFGSRLPNVMRNLGRGVTEFKKGIQGVEDEIEDAVNKPAVPDNKGAAKPTQNVDAD